jgi:hypothetical protein
MDGLGALIVIGALVACVAFLRFVLPRFGIRVG